MDSVILPYSDYTVSVAYESPFLSSSDPACADNVAAPERKIVCGEIACRHSSRHRVSVLREAEVVASCIIVASGGATGVHAHSALTREDLCFVAVGNFACALRLPNLERVWATKVDSATCFGVYDCPEYQSIISHGECEIARVNYDGKVVWSSSGRDIFSEGFILYPDHAEAVDFHGTRYHIDLNSGETKLKPG